MASANAPHDTPERKHMVRAVAAATIGTAIEWYDFIIYGLAAALVFPALFFPESNPFTGALLAFSTYFVGFAARPIGAAIFGHFGDRIGRKATLVVTLLLMGIATFLVGVVPTYEAIGIWGGVILTLLRVVQGIGVGGEWGGSVLMSLEWSEKGKRGFIASWPHMSAPLGLLMANGAIAFFSWLSGDQFLVWGWRMPFLLSILLVGVGLYIRLGVLETPVFTKLKAENRLERTPVVTAIKHHWRTIGLLALLKTSQMVAFYTFTTYVLVYATKVLGYSRDMVLGGVLVAATVSMCTMPFWGYVSDLIGRRRMTIIGALALSVFAFAYFGMLDTKAPWLLTLALVLGLIVHDMQYGPQAAFVAECFPGKLRYSGASLGYQLSAITGGPAPMIALALYEHFQSSTAIAAYIAATALLTALTALFLPDRAHEELEAPVATAA
ncbi:MAG: MFS transporter [Candidatus Sericytochromatia bacterium]